MDVHILMCRNTQLLGGLILSPVVNEFRFNGPFLSLAMNIGLFVGAVFWGFGCDIWGRRWSFNITLFLAGVVGLAAGGSPDFLTLASLLAVLGVGVGGNLPVDSAVFLDFVPGSHQFLLTILSIWWSIGQLVADFVRKHLHHVPYISDCSYRSPGLSSQTSLARRAQRHARAPRIWDGATSSSRSAA